MPIVKRKSIEELDELKDDLWCDANDEAWVRRVGKLWERSARLNPRRFTPGVFKYRTIEDAQKERESWLQQHIDSLREVRRKHRE